MAGIGMPASWVDGAARPRSFDRYRAVDKGGGLAANLLRCEDSGMSVTACSHRIPRQ